MKFKVRFRVSGFTEGESSRKFAINLEADKPFTFGGAIPELKRSVAQLVVRGGNLYVSDRKDRDVDVNGVTGKEFKLKPGDILKSGEISVEFLEVPVAVEEARTMFLDVSEIAEIEEGTRVEEIVKPLAAATPAPAPTPAAARVPVPAVEVDPVDSMIGEGAPAPYEPTRVVARQPEPAPQAAPARVYDAPRIESDPKESMIDEGGPAPYEPTRVVVRQAEPTQEAVNPRTLPAREATVEMGTELRREIVSELVKKHQQDKKLPDRAAAIHDSKLEDTRMGQLPRESSGIFKRVNPHEITSMLVRKPSDAPLQRHELFTTLGLLFLSSALTAGSSRLGFPLTWGFLGVGVAAGLAGGLYSSNAYTGAKGSFGDYLRYLSLFSFGLVAWGYAYRLNPYGGIAAGLALGGLFFWVFLRRFKPELSKFASVGGFVSALPVIASIALSWPLVPRKGEPNRAIAETETESVAAVEEGAPVRGTTQPNRQIASEQPTVPVVSQPAHTSVTLPVQPVQQSEPAQVVVHTTPAPAPVSPQVPVQQVAAQRPEAPAQDMNAQALSPVGSERASARESVPDPLASEQFFSAVKSGNLGVVKALIQRKAVDPNFTLDRGNTALMYASANGNLSIVKYLVSLRVAINARDPNGTTALMWAVYKGRTEVAKFLVSKGADVRLRRDDGDTALDIAKRWKRWDIAEVLQEASEREQSRKPASDRKRSRRR